MSLDFQESGCVPPWCECLEHMFAEYGCHVRLQISYGGRGAFQKTPQILLLEYVKFVFGCSMLFVRMHHVLLV